MPGYKCIVKYMTENIRGNQCKGTGSHFPFWFLG